MKTKRERIFSHQKYIRGIWGTIIHTAKKKVLTKYLANIRDGLNIRHWEGRIQIFIEDYLRKKRIGMRQYVAGS